MKYERVLEKKLFWSFHSGELFDASYDRADRKAFMILERWWKEGLNEVNGYDIAKVYWAILHNSGSAWGKYYSASNCSRILLKEMGEDLEGEGGGDGTLSSFFEGKEDTKLREPFENNLKGDLGNFREYFDYFHKNSWERNEKEEQSWREGEQKREQEKKQKHYEGAVLPGLEREVPFDLKKIIEIPEEKKEFLYEGYMNEEIEWRVRSIHGDEKIDKLIHEEEEFQGHTELEHIWKKTVWEMEKEIEEEYADSYELYEKEKKKQEEIEAKEKKENLVIINEKWSEVKQGLNLKIRLPIKDKWTLEQLYSPHLETNQIDDFNRKWAISGLKHWVFLPWRKGLFNIDNDFKGNEETDTRLVGEYNIAYASARNQFGSWTKDLLFPCEIVFQLHELPCTIDFWMVSDKPSPTKPFGTITFDEPKDLLEVDKLDPILVESISAEDMMKYFYESLELFPLARNELPELMLEYYLD